MSANEHDRPERTRPVVDNIAIVAAQTAPRNTTAPLVVRWLRGELPAADAAAFVARVRATHSRTDAAWCGCGEHGDWGLAA